MENHGLIQALVFIFGAVLGSFVGVCVYRLPRGFSIVASRSRCSRCGSLIHWYDNLPVVSAFVLRARCRACGLPYGAWHLGVELFLGGMALWLFQRKGLTPESVYAFALICALTTVSLIDYEFRIIPDSISLHGIWIGLVMAGVTTWLEIPWWIGFREALAGALLGAGLLWSVGRLYEAITGREGMGLGDVKLLAMFGANVGILGMLISLFYASALGLVVGLAGILLGRVKRRTPIPFAPFLSLGLFLYIILGHRWLF